MLVSAIGKLQTANKKDSLAAKNTFHGDKNAIKNKQVNSKKAAPQTTTNKAQKAKLNFLA